MTLNNETGNVKKKAFFLYSFYTSINIISLSLPYLFYMVHTHYGHYIPYCHTINYRLYFLDLFFQRNLFIKIFIFLHDRKIYINISFYFIVQETQCSRSLAFIHIYTHDICNSGFYPVEVSVSRLHLPSVLCEIRSCRQ